MDCPHSDDVQMTHGMKRIIILIILVILALPAVAQRRADFGFSLGATNYLGEINPVNVISGPGPGSTVLLQV